MKHKHHHHTHIAITSPHTGDPVEGLIQVSGTLRPPRARLQVFVRSADNRWYQQWEPVKHGGKWRCKAQIGFVDDPHATDYMIAAIGGPPIAEKVLEELPPRRPLAIVTVERIQPTAAKRAAARAKRIV
jgi:hypothetical protein